MDTTTASHRSGNSAYGEAIKVRRMDFEFGDDIPEFWFDGNPVLTAFLTSLSVSFPGGERYFIDSVRHYQPRVEEAALVQRIRAFIGQEGHHTREHTALNDMMARKGYPAKEMEQFVRERMAEVRDASSAEENLARTAALEHFTAIMAAAFLSHPKVLERMHPGVRRLWGWHAIEEIEHRAVAFDVYKAFVNDEQLRRRTMAKVTYYFILVNVLRTWKLLGMSGNQRNLGAWARAANTLWGYPGVLRKMIPHYFSYYLPRFHPAKHDYARQVADAKRRYLREQGQHSVPPSSGPPPA